MKEALTYDDVYILPSYSDVESRSNVKLGAQLTRRFWISSPFVAAPMDTVCGAEMMKAMWHLGAVGALHRFMEVEEIVEILNSIAGYAGILSGRKFPKDTPTIASIGVIDSEKRRVESLVKARANILLIDVAHGETFAMQQMLKWLKREYPEIDVIAGNVATAQGAKFLEDCGADAVRVGIGGGSMCETRVRTGVGVPQLTAVLEAANAVQIPVIADGGIRYPGDVAKALAAGADTVMIGSLLAGTDEAPGEVFETGQWPNVKRFKVYRGSASAAAKGSNGGEVKNVEGTATLVPMKGAVQNVIRTLEDGLRSSMSYVGAKNLDEFRAKAQFVRVTNAGLAEAHPHGLR